MRWVSAVGVLVASAATSLGAIPLAHGSSAVEYPDNGVAQFSRGGAWVATATDPIAGYYNPAGLVTQPTSFGIGVNVALQKICFSRKGPGDTEIGPGKQGSATYNGATYDEVCNKNAGVANAVPNVAFTWRAARAFALGLTVTPPSSYGLTEWPTTVPTDARTAPIPAPQRYLSLKLKGTVLYPTLSAAYSITPDLHVGAGFVAGVAILEIQSMSISNVQQTNAFDTPEQDTRSTLKVKDLFVPGAVAGALWSASSRIDLGVWYRVSDKIKAKGDGEVLAPYFTDAGVARTPCTAPGQANCAETTRTKDSKGEDAVKVTIPVPMELRVGARWHKPRPAATGIEAEKLRADAMPTRDPLRDDLYDMELDLTWANNSAADVVEVRFPDGITVLGLPGTIPTNADRPTGYKDSFGARLGMQYNAIRNRLGVRAGTWIESKAVDDEYLTVTGVPALRGGFGGGLVLRAERVDLEFGYQHIWNAGLDNGGDGKLKAIAGSGSPDNRSYHAVNGGSVKQHANVFSIGAVARF